MRLREVEHMNRFTGAEYGRGWMGFRMRAAEQVDDGKGQSEWRFPVNRRL